MGLLFPDSITQMINSYRTSGEDFLDSVGCPYPRVSVTRWLAWSLLHPDHPRAVDADTRKRFIEIHSRRQFKRPSEQRAYNRRISRRSRMNRPPWIRITWEMEERSISAAREQFNDLRGRGLLPYAVGDNGRALHPLSDFAVDAGEVLFRRSGGTSRTQKAGI